MDKELIFILIVFFKVKIFGVIKRLKYMKVLFFNYFVLELLFLYSLG